MGGSSAAASLEPPASAASPSSPVSLAPPGASVAASLGPPASAASPSSPVSLAPPGASAVSSHGLPASVASPSSPVSRTRPASLVSPTSPVSPGLHALLALGISHGSCASQWRLSLDGGVGTGTWCPRPSQASPSRPTSLSALFGAEFKERCAHNAKIVLRAMKRQAERDVRVETAKGTISSIIDLDSLFDEMDRRHKGYVTDTDLWSFVRDLGGSTPLHHITALISEVQLRIGRGRIVTPGHLSKRDLCILLFPIHSSL